MKTRVYLLLSLSCLTAGEALANRYQAYADRRAAETEQQFVTDSADRVNNASEQSAETEALSADQLQIRLDQIQRQVGSGEADAETQREIAALKARIRAAGHQRASEAEMERARAGGAASRVEIPRGEVAEGYSTFSEADLKARMQGAQTRLGEGQATSFSGEALNTESSTQWNRTNLSGTGTVSGMARDGLLNEAGALTTGARVVREGEHHTTTQSANASDSTRLHRGHTVSPEEAMRRGLYSTSMDQVEASGESWRDSEAVAGYVEHIKQDPEMQRALDIMIPTPDEPESWWYQNRREYIVFNTGASFLSYATALRLREGEENVENLLPGKLKRFWAPLNIYVHGRDVNFQNPKTGVWVRPNNEVTLHFQIYPTENGSRVVVRYPGSWHRSRWWNYDRHWPWVKSVIDGLNDHLEVVFGEGNQAWANSQYWNAINNARFHENEIAALEMQSQEISQALTDSRIQEREASDELSSSSRTLSVLEGNLSNTQTSGAERLEQLSSRVSVIDALLAGHRSDVNEQEQAIATKTTELETIRAKDTLSEADVAREMELLTQLEGHREALEDAESSVALQTRRKTDAESTLSSETERINAAIASAERELANHQEDHSTVIQNHTEAVAARERMESDHSYHMSQIQSDIETAQANHAEWMAVASRYSPEISDLDTESVAFIQSYGEVASQGIRTDTESAAFEYSTEDGTVDPDTYATVTLPTLGSSNGPRSRGR